MADPWLEIGDPVDQQSQQSPAKDPYAAIAEPSPAAATPQPEGAPIIISAIRRGGSPRSAAALKAAGDEATKPQEVNPSYTAAGFDVQPDTQYHSGLTEADKAEYRKFFTDPKNPPSAAMLRQWYHAKTGALMGNADQIAAFFAHHGKFSTTEKIAIPAPKTTTADASFDHLSNSAAFDYGPEAASVLASLGIGGDGPNIWNADDQSLGHLWANNADLLHARLDAEQEQHPLASTLGELGGAALVAPLGGEATDAAGLGKLAKAGVTAGEGAAYGSGAAGPGNRAAGGVTGAALGTATEAAIPLIGKFVAAVKSGDHVAAAEAVKAAQELGIDLPRFVIGGERDARRASALEQTVGGAKPISDATAKMLDQSEAAKDAIASSVGSVAAPASMGDQALAGGVQQLKANRARIGRIYDQAREAAGGTIFTATKAENTLQQLVDNENQVLGGTKAGGIFQNLLTDLKNRGGQLTIDGARDTRTELRTRLRDEAGVTPDNADRLTNMVMASINGDIESGLLDKGQTAAIPLYRQADAEWAAQRQTEDEALKPFLGKNFDNWGEEVAKKISSDARGNGTRLAQFLRAIPEDDANTVRASLITHLGTAGDGAQNAAGDAFSLDTFLTNWNKIKGSRTMIFPQDTVQSLDKLARVAQVVKAAGRTKNRSNTGGVTSYLMSGLPTLGGAAETVMTGDPKGIAVGMLVSAMNTLRQYGAAKLLASPAFAKRLAATPMHAKAATAFWSRPWVKALQLKNPTIAAEIQAFQQAFLSHANDNSALVSSAVASPDSDSQQQ